ncbi:MAG: hypothetical protein KJ645_14845 [Planctomycetes bacterium]|nr:hypothetical protein [Planctomycetota bacterium]
MSQHFSIRMGGRYTHRTTKAMAFIVSLVLVLTGLSSSVVHAQRDGEIRVARIHVPTPEIKLDLGIKNSVSYSFGVLKPVILHIYLTGEVQKEVSGGFYGRAGIQLIQNGTELEIPHWEYDIKFDDSGRSNNLSASYMLEKGNYHIKLHAGINGSSDSINFDKDSLALKMTSTVEDLVIPDWVPHINAWLNVTGLGDKIRLTAASRGPDFGFNNKSADDKVKDFVSSIAHSQQEERREMLSLMGSSRESEKILLNENTLFVFISNHLDRDSLRLLEDDFQKRQGISFWSRLFRKVTLRTGVPSKNIFGFVTVGGGASKLYETLPGIVYRHGSELCGGSFARNVPTWLNKRLGNAASDNANKISETFSTVVDHYLRSKVKSVGGEL